MGYNDEHNIYINDSLIQRAVDICCRVFENTNDGDHFWASDFYRLATNIAPDLTFGLLGARLLTNDRYIEMFQRQSNVIRDRQRNDGSVWHEYRAMYQILYPIWVYEIYMYTGDIIYLESHTKALLKAFEYLFEHEDQQGFVKLVGHGEWQYSEGADWVDWCAERMEGKTMVFQTWYYRALQCGRYIMGVLQDRAETEKYRQKANILKDNINKVFWRKNHYLDNIDFDGEEVDHFWLDSQLWPIVFGIASPSQSMYILNHIECMGDFDEGVPTRWRESSDISELFIGNLGRDNGNCTWFGRLGAGDILARYKMGHHEYGKKLLTRICEVFVKYDNVYECYDMKGIAMPKNIGGGNYLEHAGGYFKALLEGMYGIEFPIDAGQKLLVTPRFEAENAVWPGTSEEIEARTAFKYLGEEILYEYKIVKLEKNLFRKSLKIEQKGMGKEVEVKVELPFVHPLPIFTDVKEILVNGTKYVPENGFTGKVSFETTLPCNISITYHETLNSSLRGLGEGHALTDCK